MRSTEEKGCAKRNTEGLEERLLVRYNGFPGDVYGIR